MTQHQMMLAAAGGSGPLTVDTGSFAQGHSTKWAHTCSGSNRALIVSVTGGTGQQAWAVTYNGVPLTFIGWLSAGGAAVEQWKLSNPDSGTHDVIVYTYAQGSSLRAGAISFTGAHQTTASLTGTQATASGTNNSPTVNVSSATGEIVVDVMTGFDDLGGAHSHSPGAGQTERWGFDFTNLGSDAGSTEAGAGSVTMSWSLTGEIGGWAIAGVGVKPAGGDTLAFDAVSSSSTDSGAPIEWPHTCTGANRALIVGVLFESGATISSVTYNGVALTSIGGATFAGMGTRIEQWKLSAPASGTNYVIVTPSGTSTLLRVGAVSFAGAHQTTGSLTGTQANNTGVSTTPTVDVSSATGEIVADAMSIAEGLTNAATVGAGQTLRFQDPDTTDVPGGNFQGSTEAGAATVTMSWTSVSVQWGTVGVPVKPP